MNMGGAHRVAPGLQDHLANRAIGRDRIAARQDGPEEEPSIRIGDEPRPRRGSLGLVGRPLRIVIAVIVGVPDVDRHARKRFALQVGDAALHKHRFAGQIGGDIGAMRHRLVLADIERAEHGGLGRAVALAMVHRIDQHRDPSVDSRMNPGGSRAFLADPVRKSIA
jgi:hypothetical protein